MSDSEKKTDLVKLDGTIIKQDGSTYKSGFFKFLDFNPDDYSDVTYTKEEATRIRTHLSHLATGATAAIPLICGGLAKCPFSERCPFVIEHKRRKKEDPASKSPIPLGKACLVETNLLAEWTRYYIFEYEIEEDNFTDFQMVRELAEIELMLYRINSNLAKPEHGELVQETVVGVDKQGNTLTRREMNSLLEAKERFQNRKSKLVKLMVGDRQEKYKREAALRMKTDTDPSSKAAQLKGQVERLLEQAKKLELKQKEAEGNVIDIDPQDAPITPDDLISEALEEDTEE